MKLRPIWLISVLFLAGTLAVAGSSQANTYNWQTAGDGNWSTDANWSPFGHPGADDQATINPTVAAVVNGNGASVNTLTIGSQVTMTVGSDFSFYKMLSTPYSDPTLYNYGTIQVGSNAGIYVKPNLYNSAGPLTLFSSVDNPGNITLLGPNSRLDTASFNTGIRTLINGENHTIQGAGTVMASPLYNYGTILANRGTLTIQNPAPISPVYNYGTLSAAGAGNTLVVNKQVQAMSATNLIKSDGGKVQVYDLYGDTFPVNLGNGVELVNPSPSNPPLNLLGKINVTSGSVFNINANYQTVKLGKAGGSDSLINNNGIINLSGVDGAYAYMYAYSNAKFTGSGRLVLDGNSSTALYSYYYVGWPSSAHYTYTNDVNHTIEGGGTLGYYSYSTDLVMTNNGKIIANNNTLQIAQRIDGNGSVEADGGKLDIQANLTTKDLTLTSKAGTGLNVVKPNSWTPAPIVEVTGNFLYSLNDPSKWNWGTGTTLKMSGPQDEWHFLEAGGSGFSLRTLNISGDIALVDWYDNTPGSGAEALYVDSLTWDGSTLNLNGRSLYVNGIEVLEGAYDGKVINELLPNPNVPLPPTVWLLGSGLLGLVGWRRFRKG